MFDHDHLMKSEQIFDDFLGKDQACVNCDFFNRIKSLEEAGAGHSYKLVQIEDPDNLVSFQLQDEEGTVYGDTIRIPDAQILIDSGFKIVESLPESGPDEKDKNKIFLVPKESEEESDVYDEYIWVNDKWEPIGSSKITVDLSDYLKKDEASKLYQPKEDSGDPYVKESALTDFAKITEVDGKKVVALPESVQLMGTIGEAIYALAAIQKYAQEEGADLIQVEIGTTSFHLNLNTADNITYDTPQGKKTVATIDQIPGLATAETDGLMGAADKAKLDGIDDSQIPYMINLPLRTSLNKVFTQEEILADWFHVESVAEFKNLIVSTPIYTRFGITIPAGQPKYYRQFIQYAAFESANQVKFVWVGLNTSNDAAVRYTFIVNLDGTVIENGCNASLVLEELALKSDLPSFTVIEELTGDYMIPANPTSKEFTYEIHVGETVHSITGAAGIIWQNGEAPNVQANHIYAVSVINNLAVWGEF